MPPPHTMGPQAGPVAAPAMMGSQTIVSQTSGSYATRGPPTWPMSLFTSQDLSEQQPQDAFSHGALMRMEGAVEDLRKKLNIESASRVTAIEGLHTVAGGMRGDMEQLHKEMMALAEAQERTIKNMEKQMSHLQSLIQETVGKQVTSEERLMTIMKQRLDAMEAKLSEDLRKESSVREADVYELRELVGGEQLARQGHHSSIQEILEEERKAREAHMYQERKAREAHMDHLTTHADRLDGHADNHNALIDRVAELEELMKKETGTREADIYELREIVGGEQLARQGHHANIQEILEEERKARELHLNDLQNRHDDHANNHMALVERLDALEKLLQAKAEHLLEMIGHETKTRELHLGKLDEHTQVSKEIQGALDKLETKLHNEIAREQSTRDVNLTQMENKLRTEIVKEQGTREHDIQELRAHAENQMTSLQRIGMLEAQVKEEKDIREADIYELRELVGGEQLARQGHHANMQEILEEERKAREHHLMHLNDHADRHDAHMSNHNAVVERLSDLEQTVQNQILGSQDQVLLSRVNDLERHIMNEAQVRDNEIGEIRNHINVEKAAVQSLEQQMGDAKASASHVAAHLNNEIKNLREALDTHTHDFDERDEREEAPVANTVNPQPYVVTRTIALAPQQVPPPPQSYLVQPQQPPHQIQQAPPQQFPAMPAPKSMNMVPAAAPITYSAPPAAPTSPALTMGSVQIPPVSLTSVIQQPPVAYPDNTIASPNSKAKRKSLTSHHTATTGKAKYNSPTTAAPLVA